MSKVLDITVPETKPATEWVRGRALQKMSPRTAHAYAQTKFVVALDAWAERSGLGYVGSEWDFRIAPPGEAARPLVPDVAFLAFARLSQEEQDRTDFPRCAPNAAVEILSPGDLRADVEHKIGVYLAAGCEVVVEVDLRRRFVRAHDVHGEKTWHAGEWFEHPALPGFRLPVDSLFRPKR
ncbi:MAG TPA: Uma2 family endonuclease [Candidatus Tumulicola sp.]|nr:Uma2 family endonuclease [Candidatus Tumulicola sp.]